MLIPVVAIFQNCGRTETTGAGVETSSIVTYIDVRSTSSLGYNNFLGGACSELSFTVKYNNGKLALSEESTGVTLRATLVKFPGTADVDDSLFSEQITYESLDDCLNNINGISMFTFPAQTGFVKRWTIFAAKDMTKAQDQRMIRMKIENPLFNTQYSGSLSSYGNINIYSDTDQVIYLSGPEFAQKGACVAYDVGYMNFKGEQFSLPSSGYYFSNYSLSGDTPYKAFSDANCTLSILAQKNVMLSKVFLKFYNEPYTERANPTVVLVIPGNPQIIKVGWLIVWTEN